MVPAARSGEALERMPRLTVELALSSSDVAAAQRLRHRVFVDEMGAHAIGRNPGREQDFFDPWCEHLIVRDQTSGEVVGTGRMLTAANARRLGTFCAEREFDLTRLAHLRPQIVEVGRACVDVAYRTGAASLMLWSGIARFARECNATYLIGCASLSMADGGANAAAVYNHLARRHLAPVEYRVVSRSPLAAYENSTLAACTIPSLVKSYLQLGAWISGEPAWDPDFDLADLLVFLPLARLEASNASPYLQERQAA